MNSYQIEFRYVIQRNCQQDWHIKPDIIEYNNLVFVLEGEVLYFVNNQVFHLYKNDVICIPANSKREAKRVNQSNLSIQSFDFFSNQKMPNFKDFILHCPSLEVFKPLFNKFNQSWLIPQEYSSIRLHYLFFQIWDELLSIAYPKQEKAIIQKIKTYVESHYREKLTIQKVSKIVDLHPAYCGNLFLKETGATIIQYWRSIQIRKACLLLEDTSISIKQVAYESGFDDIYYFSKIFKNITGKCPTKMRNK